MVSRRSLWEWMASRRGARSTLPTPLRPRVTADIEESTAVEPPRHFQFTVRVFNLRAAVPALMESDLAEYPAEKWSIRKIPEGVQVEVLGTSGEVREIAQVLRRRLLPSWIGRIVDSEWSSKKSEPWIGRVVRGGVAGATIASGFTYWWAWLVVSQALGAFSVTPEEVGFTLPTLLVRLAVVPVVFSILTVSLLEFGRALPIWARRRSCETSIPFRLLTSFPEGFFAFQVAVIVVFVVTNRESLAGRKGWVLNSPNLLGSFFLLLALTVSVVATWVTNFLKTPRSIISGYVEDVADESGASILGTIYLYPLDTYNVPGIGGKLGLFLLKVLRRVVWWRVRRAIR